MNHKRTILVAAIAAAFSVMTSPAIASTTFVAEAPSGCTAKVMPTSISTAVSSSSPKELPQHLIAKCPFPEKVR